MLPTKFFSKNWAFAEPKYSPSLHESMLILKSNLSDPEADLFAHLCCASFLSIFHFSVRDHPLRFNALCPAENGKPAINRKSLVSPYEVFKGFPRSDH